MCSGVTQKKHGQRTTKQYAFSSMDQNRDARDDASYMQSVRERLVTSKRRLTVSDVEKIVHEEIISAALRESRRKHTKPNPQQRRRDNFSEIRLESVLCTDFPPNASKSCDAPWPPPEPKKSTHGQKHRSGLWLPKLPAFVRMPTWRTVRVHNLEKLYEPCVN